MSGDIPSVFTSAAEVRALFNSEVLPRVAEGRVQVVVLQEAPASRRSNQPRGTRSQILGYFDGGTMVARAHRFASMDETIGGSGLPDPKWVLHDGVILLAD
ncbi:MAG: hypothetical protein M3323_14085 [Actinomycetota bacterium]|nr:hypothetical protein [Actinomycetota bacterium]